MGAAAMSERAERRWRWRAIALSLMAALVHIVVSPVYFGHWIGYGAVIITVAALQGIGAMALIAGRSPRFYLPAGILGNSAIVLLWFITRTIGVPLFGPAAGEVWPVGVPDLVATLLELALIAHLVVLLARFRDEAERPLLD